MSKQIIVTIKDDGSTSVKTEGFKGSSCVADSEFIKKALGNLKQVSKTSEFYEKATIGNKQCN